MDKLFLTQQINNFIRSSEKNLINTEQALSATSVGMRIFDEAAIAFGDASDLYYEQLKAIEAIGPHFCPPLNWLQNAKTVISYFCPFTQSIRDSNKRDFSYPSVEWMHGRIEGEAFLDALGLHLVAVLKAAGYDAVAPSGDERLLRRIEGNRFTSNWSERHVAYTCGLGTFSLSKGLITRKGVAGRFGSVVTNWAAKVYDTRDYDGLYDYCTMCGLCISQCPVNAISFENGKDHVPCSAFLDEVRSVNPPYYGCGKCQISVPCENKIPQKKS